MHFTTSLLAFLWLAGISNAAPQLRDTESSLEGTSTTTRRVLRTAFVTVSLPASARIQSTPPSDVLTPAAGGSEQHSTLSSSPPTPEQSGGSSVDSSTTHSQAPSPKPQSTQGPDTTFAVSALAQPASAPLPSVATSIAPQAAVPPPAGAAAAAAAAAALTTPPPQVPSFEDAYGDEFTQTTYWSCNTFALTTQCGWHEPILYIGGAKSGASRGKSLISGGGGYGGLVLGSLVVGVVMLF